MRGLDYKWLVGITFVLGLIMQILDITILNVALAALGREFHADAGTLQWVLTGYMVSLAVFVPSSGWIADRFGSKRTFQSAVIIFTGASILCGFASSIGMLIASRVLQGVGGGMLVPVGQAMLFRAFPPSERAKASAVLSIPITAAPALGPVLGGILVQFASWRWIFFINLPVGVLTLAFTILFLREEHSEHPGRFDFPGFVLAGAGLATLLFGLDQGAQAGWANAMSWGPLSTAVVLIAGLIWRELSIPEPMLNLRLLGHRLFGTGNGLLLCMTGAMFSVLFLMPLYLQSLRGIAPMTTGLVLMPQALSMVVVTQVVSRIYGRVGPKRLLMLGFTIQALVGVSTQMLGTNTSLVLTTGLLMMQGVAMGLLMTPLQTASFAQTSRAAMGHASSLFNVSRQVATALGTAVVATVLVALTESGMTHLHPTSPAAVAAVQLGAYHGAFLVSVVFALLGIVLSTRLRDADAVATLGPTHRLNKAEPALAR